MKKFLALLTATSLFGGVASAGDLAEPVITEVDEPEAVSSAPWLPILLLIAVGLAVASQDDNSVIVE